MSRNLRGKNSRLSFLIREFLVRKLRKTLYENESPFVRFISGTQTNAVCQLREASKKSNLISID